jgi:phospholipase/lecithinase/hemolysin
MGFMAGMTRSLRAAGGVLAAALIVAACGGGSSRESFTPTRLMAFGDESSVITSDGHKYTINALTTDGTGAYDCASNAIWVQVLASAYGFGFQQCKPTGITNEQALMRATANAKVADLVTQIDAHLATDAFTGKDLVTVLVGANDILEQYSAYPGQSEDELKATLTVRGAAVAGQVNRIANAGGKVLAVTVPDVGLTPFALAQGADRAALLQRLTAAFNTALRLNLLNDGTKIGLVIEDELVQAYVNAGANSGFTNWTEHACDPATGQLPNCTTSTLVTGATSTSYLWADDLQLSPGGHARLGSAALTRAQNNPF